LAHPYLEAYVRSLLSALAYFAYQTNPMQHDPDDEPVAPPLDPEFFEFDRE
jgi:mitogen-activated protein kinase 1/3